MVSLWLSLASTHGEVGLLGAENLTLLCFLLLPHVCIHGVYPAPNLNSRHIKAGKTSLLRGFDVPGFQFATTTEVRTTIPITQTTTGMLTKVADLSQQAREEEPRSTTPHLWDRKSAFWRGTSNKGSLPKAEPMTH
jgi:hypothetical protein